LTLTQLVHVKLFIAVKSDTTALFCVKALVVLCLPSEHSAVWYWAVTTKNRSREHYTSKLWPQSRSYQVLCS